MLPLNQKYNKYLIKIYIWLLIQEVNLEVKVKWQVLKEKQNNLNMTK